MTSGSFLQLPKLKAEKLRSISSMVKTVAQSDFLSDYFRVTEDSAFRMKIIGVDDRRLGAKLKELFVMEMSFLLEGIFVPLCQACTIFLLKYSTSVGSNSASASSSSGSNNSSSSLAPLEYLSLLAFISTGLTSLRSHFDSSLAPALSPNLIASLKEMRRKSIQSIEKGVNDSLHAFILAIGSFIDRSLSISQQKNDFLKIESNSANNGIISNISSSINNITENANIIGAAGLSGIIKKSSFFGNVIEPTSACDLICRALISIANEIRQKETIIAPVFKINELLWKPLGRQIIGCLLAHFRRQKISMDGAKIFLRDLEEYFNVTRFLFLNPNLARIMILIFFFTGSSLI